MAIIVRLDSPGPVFFRQTRIGRRGRPFEMLKFRTMVRDASDDLHRELVLPWCGAVPAMRPSAVRFRSVGSTSWPTIRASRVPAVGCGGPRLDELPQLFNVLRGEMSLVGPRPPMIYEYDAYAAWQLERLEMPQGMTGLWQVSGRSYLSYRRMHELDIEYVRRWSLWLDLRILAKTVRAVFVDAEPSA